MALVDAVALLVAHLAPIVAPVQVAGRVPASRPAELVQVRRVAGPAMPPVREIARIDVFAWADTDPRAVTIGNQVRAAVWALAGNATLGVNVYQVSEFKGPGLDDDPLTGASRVWATYDLHVRADEIIHIAP